MVISVFKSGLAILLVALLFGCAAPAVKPRPAFAGSDEVSAVTTDRIVGNWFVRLANPTDEERSSWGNTQMVAVTSFKRDGTFSTVTQSTPMQFKSQTDGSWSIAEGSIIMRATSTQNLSEKKVSAIVVSDFMDNFDALASGSANVYSASKEKLILVNEQSGIATELTPVR